MANSAKINPQGGKVSWSLSVTNLMLGLYHARVYGSSNSVQEKWDNQRTDDSLPDTFEMKTPPDQLIGGSLWWECNVSDPSDEGGKYVCMVSVSQDGTILCQDAVSGEVPAGSGQIDAIGDQITFS